MELTKIKQQQQLIQNAEKLEITKEKLRTAQRFVQEFENNIGRFDFKDEKFSASSLLLATLQQKQRETQDLQVEINDLEMKVASSLTGREEDILNYEKQIDEIEKSLIAPETENAKFAAPIYAPSKQVEPRVKPLVILGSLIGLFTGCIIALIRNRREFISTISNQQERQT